MSNPVFERMRDSRGYATFGPPAARQVDTAYSSGGRGYGAPADADLEQMYAAPSANSVQTGRMTYDDVMVKTGLVFLSVLAGGAVGWQLPGLMLIGLIGGLVLGLVNSFKAEPSPVLIIGYGLLEGVFLGAVSHVLNDRYSGIVAQAVLGTLSVFAVVLIGFRSGRLRTSPKLNKIFFIAMAGYLLFSLVNVGLMLFAGHSSLRGGALGLLISGVAVVLASYALVMDFEFIKLGVEQGAPARYAWTGAFGLVVTLVWLYIEILRILSILRD